MDESIDAAAREANRALLGRLPAGRTLVMGILNVTPDSFSDGGEHATVRAAVEHARRMVADGADIVDVGGESTRPDSERVDPREEQRRVLAVIRELSDRGVVVSVDTLHPDTAEAALDAGAHIINDVSGTNLDPRMIELAGDRGVPYVLMHSRGTPQTMTSLADYDDTVTEVLAELEQLRERCLAAGIRPEHLMVDPGLGFAKAGEQNWELLRALPRLTGLGKVLIAASRKRFVGALLATQDGPRPVDERDTATAAISALSAFGGAWAVRVHDVPTTVDAVAAAHAWRGVTPPVLHPRDMGN